MAANHEYVLIYQTWVENAAKLGPEKQTKALMQIIRYGLYGEVPDNSDDLYLDLLLSDWMPLVDASKQKRRGGAPKGNQNAKGNKGGTGRPKKTQPKNTTFKDKEYTKDKEKEYTNEALPSVDTPASEVAGDTTSGFANQVDDGYCDYDAMLKEIEEDVKNGRL